MKQRSQALRLFSAFARFAPAVILMALVCRWSDPAHLFNPGFETGMARALLSGHDVAGVANFDERRLQASLIAGFRESPTIAVFGSSRALELSRSLAPGTSFFNQSVSGASLEDYVALFDLYAKRAFRPRVVIIGVDPWLFNAGDPDSRWHSIADAYADGLKRIDEGAGRAGSWLFFAKTDKYLQLVSPSYFQASLRNIPTKLRAGGQRNFLAPQEPGWENLDVKRSDGSLRYPAAMRNAGPDRVRMAALAFIGAQGAYRLNHFDKLDPEALGTFEALLRAWERNGATVVLLLSPYHPIVYKQLTADPKYKMVQVVEHYAREAAARMGISVVGSFDPEKLRAGDGDFYDGMHPHGDCLQRALAPAVERALNATASREPQ